MSDQTLTTEKAGRPRAITWIVIIIVLTISRISVAFSIPDLEMFGGVQPDAWVGPWVADTILGILAPLMAFLALRRTGVKLWGALIAYNAVGAFDYAHGMATQWVHPQIGTPAAGIFIFIGFFMIIQLITVFLLFRSDVMQHLMPSSIA